MILRESYKISDNPDVSIKIYHGKFEGFHRVEVEFSSENDAENFIPLDWFGKEITDSHLGKDSLLVSVDSKI